MSVVLWTLVLSESVVNISVECCGVDTSVE